MTAPAKFLFDTDFGRGDRRAGGSPAERQAQVAEAEARGYRNGLLAGRNEARLEAEQQLANALAQVAAGLATLAHDLTALEAKVETEAVQVAVAVGSRLSNALLQREPFAEVEALAVECFRQLVGAPHLVVRVSEPQFEVARERLDELAVRSGFQGKLVVLADPEINAGDCRIEWADGGMVRDRAATAAAIADGVGRYLAVRRNASAGSSRKKT
jgi:flagellar assembly protein FliH